MAPISPDEYAQMERLMAALLPHCDPAEETALLALHNKLETIYDAQSDLNASRSRLMTLQSQMAR